MKEKIQSMLDRAKFIKEKYIDQGKMGASSGEGFYTYPNPGYADPDFLSDLKRAKQEAVAIQKR